MVAMVDEIVGNITSMMKAKGWWDETLMIFSADNGGSIATSENAASNYPLVSPGLQQLTTKDLLSSAEIIFLLCR